MCGRYALFSTAESLEKEFGVAPPLFRPRYNIAPGQDILAISMHDKPQFSVMRWGLIPHWAKDTNIGYKMINAKAETILEKPSYKRPFQTNRCLIVADGFYEWKKVQLGKIPYFITMKDKKPFSLAGIFDEWKSPQGMMTSCSIITTKPNAVVHQIHDRMPVIISKDSRMKWLEYDETNALSLLKSYPAREMEAKKASGLVNNPKNDTPELLRG